MSSHYYILELANEHSPAGNVIFCKVKQVTWLVITKVQSESFGLATECRHSNACPIYVLLSYVAHFIFFFVECGIARFLCAMHVFDIPASSSPARLPLCQISFLWQPPLLRHPMEKNRVLNQSITQSVTHSPSLFVVLDRTYLMPWEPKLSLQNKA